MKSWENENVKSFIDDNNTQFNRIEDPDYDYELIDGINRKDDGSNVDCCTVQQMLDWGVELVTVV